LGQLVAQLVDLGSSLPDHHAWPAGVHGHRHLARLALDVDVRDRRVAEPGLEVLPDQLVLFEELGKVAARVVAGAPHLDDPEPESVRMSLLSHVTSLPAGTWSRR